MKKLIITLSLIGVGGTALYLGSLQAQTPEKASLSYEELYVLPESNKAPAPSKVDFDAFEDLTREVKKHRKNRLINWETFKKFSEEEGVVILDTRSPEMFKEKHIKGAINLNFSDFTQANLAELIPSPDTKILIYCNNNFSYPVSSVDERVFATKAYVPPVNPAKTGPTQKELTLALNIPTFINLYGYGYKNVYELSELMYVLDPRVEFEGTNVE